jgi:GNAT superfamily N-acetyltransferase
MIVRPITDKNEAFATHRILGELVAVKNVEQNTEVPVEAITDRLCQQLLCNPNYTLLGCFDERGAVMGYICGEVRQDIFTGDICGFELLWVVGDRYRKSGVGLALLRAWEEHCKKCGATRSYMGLNMSTQPEILRSVYPKLGYRLQSECYSKDL